MTDIDHIADALSLALALDYNLPGARVKHRVNPFGFTLVSLAVSCGRKRLHVKLAPRGREDGLRKWFRHTGALQRGYRAPRVWGWVDLRGVGYCGMVFDHVPARSPGARAMAALAPRLARLIDRLHHDAGLARALRGTGQPEPDIAVMIREGVQIACDRPPPFVRKSDVPWLRREGEASLRALRDVRDGWKPCAIHGDLWAGNLLAQGARWWVIDWDELALGDPATDWAAMAFMAAPGGGFEQGLKRLGRVPQAATLARARVHHRALVFSYIVDLLADWHEAKSVPAHAARVRAGKQKLYERWLGVYRRWYG